MLCSFSNASTIEDCAFSAGIQRPFLMNSVMGSGIVPRAGGFGSAVLELLSEAAPGVEVRRIGLPDRFVEHGNKTLLMKDIGLDPAAIADKFLSNQSAPV